MSLTNRHEQGTKSTDDRALATLGAVSRVDGTDRRTIPGTMSTDSRNPEHADEHGNKMRQSDVLV